MADPDNPDMPEAPDSPPTPPPEPDTEYELADDDPANRTEFRNLYIPSFSFPEAEEEKQVSRHHREEAYQVSLSDQNATRFGDTTRVGWKGRVDYAINAYQTARLKAKATEHEIQRDPTALLNVTITTVILLASGIFDIPIEYYLYTELYLLSIRDEFYDSPPNIENLIKHMRYIRQNNNITWESEYVDEPPPGLLISKIPNRSRIPLPIHSRSFKTATRGSKDLSTSKADSEPPPEEEAPAEPEAEE